MKFNFKFALIFIMSSMITLSAFSQIIQPAKWKVEFSKKDVKVGETLEVLIKGDIQKTWHVYSNDFDPDLGPIVATFNFGKNDSYELLGGVTPIKPHKHYDELWEGDVSYFEDKAEFRQKIKVLKSDVKIVGSFEYQACTDVDGRCVTGEEDFNISMTAKALVAKKTEAKAAVKEPVVKKEEPKKIAAVVKKEVKSEAKTPAPVKEEKKESKGLWTIFIAAFVGGLIAIVTPCVFPMIPMTVSYFMHSGGGNKAKGRMNAFFYGFSIIAIYTIIGTILAVVMGPGFANFLSTHWVPNVFFFLIFVVFAFSFFGMFEITMPSWMVNKSVSNEDKGGFMGSFFMAFTLVLVSFSCTGPIVGSILVASAGGEVLMPIIGMLGFSLAFALPFTLFAIFPGLLKNMPKSGGWLNSVKVVLGFLELALGLKFLSIADQTYHWGILDREVYLAIWIVIFTLMGFYLLGKLMFSHDSPVKHVSVPRLMLAIASFSFVVYMIPGLFGAPLKALSGYMPPKASLDFDIQTLVRNNSNSGGNSHQDMHTAKYADFLHLPHGLNGYFDMEEAKAAAKAQNKPLFIDFTGHGCVNCREMESNVWSNPEVLRRLRDEYVIVAMYVDDKKSLPESEWITSNYDGKVKKTLGKKNANYQIENYNMNAQPYYVLLDNNGQDLNTPRAYDLDVDRFIEFLDEGIKNFKNGKSAAI